MASAMISVALVLAMRVVAVEATEVFGAQQQGEQISKDTVGQMLTSPSKIRVSNITEELQSTFATLPKNAHGRVEPSTVRYAVHRYFVQKHGWYVKGLDPEGDGWKASSSLPSDDIMKGHAPVYIQEHFATKFHDTGLDINDVAVFVATVADLVFQENLGHLRRVYDKLELSTSDPVPESSFDMAIRACLADLITGDLGSFHGDFDFPALEEQAKSFYPEYDDHVKLLRSLYPYKKFVDAASPATLRFRPLASSRKMVVPFEVAEGFLHEFMHNFGTTQAADCRQFKKDLVKMDQAGTGRVLLSDFYGNQKLQLREGPDYLRNLGAYEEVKGTPMLIIPNLMSSPSRCMPFSSYSSVCCPDECHGLLGELERQVGEPSPPLARIAELVPMLPSDTVEAPRSLPTLLLSRLDDIAQRHDGLIPLHGRLFMQWMHHAYPRECPYPHAAGTTKPVSQDEWMLLHQEIEDVQATSVERTRQMLVLAGPSSRPMGFEDLPWSNVEELVDGTSGDFHYHIEVVRAVFACTALLSVSFAILARLKLRAPFSNAKHMSVV